MEYKPRIFENAPGQCRYGKREFMGYVTSHLPTEPPTPFILLETSDLELEETLKKLNSLIENYIKNANGHIHWRQGSYIWQDKETKLWKASVSLLVNEYLPKEFR